MNRIRRPIAAIAVLGLVGLAGVWAGRTVLAFPDNGYWPRAIGHVHIARINPASNGCWDANASILTPAHEDTAKTV